MASGSKSSSSKSSSRTADAAAALAKTSKKNERNELHIKLKVYFMFLCPAVICAMYFAASFTSEGLFYHTLGGVTYSIGTVGYTVNGIQAIPSIPGKVSFDYPTPPSWPAPIRGIPKLLVAHFAVAPLLAVYICMYLAINWALQYERSSAYTEAQRKEGRGLTKIKQALHQKGVLQYFTVFMVLTVLALLVADAVVVASCVPTRDQSMARSFIPAPAGYGFGVTASVFELLWGLAWLALHLHGQNDEWIREHIRYQHENA